MFAVCCRSFVVSCALFVVCCLFYGVCCLGMMFVFILIVCCFGCTLLLCVGGWLLFVDCCVGV